MILFLISFLAGALTALAPCTISLLPVIVGGSIGEGQSKYRPLVITASLGVSVILFTFILKVSTAFINIPQSFWTGFSGTIIIVMGLIMVFPALWEKLPFVNKMNMGSNRLLATGYQKKGIAGDIIVGAALGPVFSSCSPTYFLILATVLPKSIPEGIVYLLAYVVGLCGLLLLITIASQKIINKLGIVADSHGWFKRSIGILFVIIGVAILFGLDKKLELVVSNHVFDVTTIEQKLLKDNAAATGTASNGPALPTDSTATLVPYSATQSATDRIAAKALVYPAAPEISNPSGFINTGGQPITIAAEKEKKVVLVDFWTYSCINCQRTIPYLNAWYQKYKDYGLEIIGVHTPEFAFEKVQSNVQAAVGRFGIQYPVVMDNDYGTWNAFGSEYWPNKYLVDIDGYIVYNHSGEGSYAEEETAIQKALIERAAVLGLPNNIPTGTVDPSGLETNANENLIQSPETYFGSNRNEYLGNGTPGVPGTQSFDAPMLAEQVPNTLYLSGVWNINPEYAETSDSDAKIIYQYNAKDLYFVASSAKGATIKVMVDGQPVGAAHGDDVSSDGMGTISGNRLYKLVQGASYGPHTIEIDVTKGTLDAYTFTFG